MKKITALFGGSFKPPTKGHLEVVLQGLKQNPEIGKVLIAVGQGVRENITQPQSVKIWETYQRLIPVESEIIPVNSPYLFYRNYLKEHKEDKVYVFIGARPNNEKDRVDILERTQFVKKYSKNVIPTEITTKEEMSGTKARKYLRENIEKFYKFLPNKLTETEKIQTILEISGNKILYAFDLDDTLITSKSKVIVTNPEQGTFKLTPTEYAVYEHGPEDELDFSEFSSLNSPKVIKDNFKLFSQILKKSSNLPNAQTIILTARPLEIAEDVKQFLEKNDLPNVRLYAVGSSDPEEKLKVIQDYIDRGYNKVRFYDDSKPNIDLIKTLNSPDTEVITRLVTRGPLSEIIIDEDKKDYFGLIRFINEIAEEKIDYNPYIDSLNKHMEDNGMNISPHPQVNFVEDDADNASDIFGKTAFYDPNQREITLYTMGRHPKDILRSYAHEMIHHLQNLEDRLGDIKGTDTREDDHLTDIEREAYTDGNLTFRKWTETLTEGQIKELDIQNPQEIKFWALHAHLFSLLKKDPSRFKELKSKLSGESLGALYYFWGLLEKGELNEDKFEASLDDTKKYKMGKEWFKRWWKPKKEMAGWTYHDDGKYIWLTRPKVKQPTIRFEKSTGLLQGDWVDYKERQW